MKKQQNTVLAISQIAQKNPNGFTVDHNLRPITNGYSVATKYTQNSFGLTGLAHVVAIALFQNLEGFDGVGGWLNTENSEYYYDAIKIFSNEAEANLFAFHNDQISFFDLTNGIEIKTTSPTLTGGIGGNVGFSSSK
jgi:hypothetical protein